MKWYLMPIWILLVSALLVSCDPSAPNPGDTNGPVSDLPARTIKDTAYGTQSKHTMDIYLPAGRNTNTKVIFLVHGGAWKSGAKEDMNVLIPLIQAQWNNVAIVNMNYRLANGSTVIADTIMQDISNAVRFIADNSAGFAVSSSFGMIGASAGAQLCLLYGYKYNQNNWVKAVGNLYGPSNMYDWSWYNSFNVFLGSSIKDIMINYIGTAWDTVQYAAVSPYTQLSAAQNVPTISFHGNLDPIVPVYHSQWLKAKLDNLNIANEYYEYTDTHGFNATNNADAMQKTVVFFKSKL